MMFRNFGWMPFGLMGGVCIALFIALVVVLIVFAVRGGRNHRHDFIPPHGMPNAPQDMPPHSSSNAEQILKDRLAKGEIDEATYENILKKIRE